MDSSLYDRSLPSRDTVLLIVFNGIHATGSGPGCHTVYFLLLVGWSDFEKKQMLRFPWCAKML